MTDCYRLAVGAGWQPYWFHRGGAIPPPPPRPMTATLNATCTCPACGGTGKLPHYSHIANGDCFACGATGQIRDLTAFIGPESDVSLEVEAFGGRFRGAWIRCRTWKVTGAYKTWGRDRWAREITDANEARRIWRDAKRLGITTSLFD